MKTLQTSYSGFEELTDAELLTVDGGFWWVVVGGVAAAVGAQILADWDDFKAGLSGTCPKP